MTRYPSLRRCLAALVSIATIGGVVVLAAVAHRPAENPAPESQPDAKAYPWPMWGGALSRNMVNLRDHNVPIDWNIEKKTNILWAEDLGSKAYGGPVVADGKIFVGTNNEK